MFKNVIIKRYLKNTVFHIATIINKIVPKRDDYILLYSANKGIGFNLLPLKEYLLAHHYQDNNRIVCGVETKLYFGNEDGIEYMNKIFSYLFFFRARHVFYTAGQIPVKPANNQIVLHMHHGITFKSAGAMTNINNGDEFYFTYCFGTSEIYRDIYSRSFCCGKENVLINSEPMTDILINGNVRKYNLGNYKKIILWTPTFRQSDYLGYDDSLEKELLPLFHQSEYDELNSVLKSYGFKLIVKIHPAQDLSQYKQLIFTNLSILSNNDFENMKMDLYNLMPQTDALITDYSSIFLQYLLVDKPIAFAIPDFDDYKKHRGFAFDNPKDYMPGVQMYTKQDFYMFLDDLSKNIDIFKEKRFAIKNKIHKYSDGKSCERLIKISKIRKAL